MSKMSKQIVIIESSPSDTLTKMAYVLRKKGYETVFISLVSNIETDFLKLAYDKIISPNLKFFKINKKNAINIAKFGIRKLPDIVKSYLEIRHLDPYAVIVRTTPNWLFFPAKKYFKNCPVIYFPYDIRSFSYKTKEEAIASGIPKFELEAERYSFTHADGIIHKGSEDELQNLNTDILGAINIMCPDIFFLPYALKEIMADLDETKLSSKDKKTHIVYVGALPIDKTWFRNAEFVTKQGIIVHGYSKTNNLTKEQEKKRVNDNIKGLFSSEFIKIHDSVGQMDLPKEIAKYDYGIYSFTDLGARDYNYATGNKIASYLEGGIPIIAPKQFTAVCEIIKKYGIGISVDSDQFGKLAQILKKNKREKYRKNIIHARHDFGFWHQIERLEQFIEETWAFKNAQTN